MNSFLLSMSFAGPVLLAVQDYVSARNLNWSEQDIQDKAAQLTDVLLRSDAPISAFTSDDRGRQKDTDDQVVQAQIVFLNVATEMLAKCASTPETTYQGGVPPHLLETLQHAAEDSSKSLIAQPTLASYNDFLKDVPRLLRSTASRVVNFKQDSGDILKACLKDRSNVVDVSRTGVGKFLSSEVLLEAGSTDPELNGVSYRQAFQLYRKRALALLNKTDPEALGKSEFIAQVGPLLTKLYPDLEMILGRHTLTFDNVRATPILDAHGREVTPEEHIHAGTTFGWEISGDITQQLEVLHPEKGASVGVDLSQKGPTRSSLGILRNGGITRLTLCVIPRPVTGRGGVPYFIINGKSQTWAMLLDDKNKVLRTTHNPSESNPVNETWEATFMAGPRGVQLPRVRLGRQTQSVEQQEAGQLPQEAGETKKLATEYKEILAEIRFDTQLPVAREAVSQKGEVDREDRKKREKKKAKKTKKAKKREKMEDTEDEDEGDEEDEEDEEEDEAKNETREEQDKREEATAFAMAKAEAAPPLVPKAARQPDLPRFEHFRSEDDRVKEEAAQKQKQDSETRKWSQDEKSKSSLRSIFGTKAEAVSFPKVPRSDRDFGVVVPVGGGQNATTVDLPLRLLLTAFVVSPVEFMQQVYRDPAFDPTRGNDPLRYPGYDLLWKSLKRHDYLEGITRETAVVEIGRLLLNLPSRSYIKRAKSEWGAREFLANHEVRGLNFLANDLAFLGPPAASFTNLVVLTRSVVRLYAGTEGETGRTQAVRFGVHSAGAHFRALAEKAQLVLHGYMLGALHCNRTSLKVAFPTTFISIFQSSLFTNLFGAFEVKTSAKKSSLDKINKYVGRRMKDSKSFMSVSQMRIDLATLAEDLLQEVGVTKKRAFRSESKVSGLETTGWRRDEARSLQSTYRQPAFMGNDPAASAAGRGGDATTIGNLAVDTSPTNSNAGFRAPTATRTVVSVGLSPIGRSALLALIASTSHSVALPSKEDAIADARKEKESVLGTRAENQYLDDAVPSLGSLAPSGFNRHSRETAPVSQEEFTTTLAQINPFLHRAQASWRSGRLSPWVSFEEAQKKILELDTRLARARKVVAGESMDDSVDDDDAIEDQQEEQLTSILEAATSAMRQYLRDNPPPPSPSPAPARQALLEGKKLSPADLGKMARMQRTGAITGLTNLFKLPREAKEAAENKLREAQKKETAEQKRRNEGNDEEKDDIALVAEAKDLAQQQKKKDKKKQKSSSTTSDRAATTRDVLKHKLLKAKRGQHEHAGLAEYMRYATNAKRRFLRADAVGGFERHLSDETRRNLRVAVVRALDQVHVLTPQNPEDRRRELDVLIVVDGVIRGAWTPEEAEVYTRHLTFLKRNPDLRNSCYPKDTAARLFSTFPKTVKDTLFSTATDSPLQEQHPAVTQELVLAGWSYLDLWYDKRQGIVHILTTPDRLMQKMCPVDLHTQRLVMTQATRRLLEPAMRVLANRLFQGQAYSLSLYSDPSTRAFLETLAVNFSRLAEENVGGLGLMDRRVASSTTEIATRLLTSTGTRPDGTTLASNPRGQPYSYVTTVASAYSADMYRYSFLTSIPAIRRVTNAKVATQGGGLPVRGVSLRQMTDFTYRHVDLQPNVCIMKAMGVQTRDELAPFGTNKLMAVVTDVKNQEDALSGHADSNERSILMYGHAVIAYANKNHAVAAFGEAQANPATRHIPARSRDFCYFTPDLGTEGLQLEEYNNLDENVQAKWRKALSCHEILGTVREGAQLTPFNMVVAVLRMLTDADVRTVYAASQSNYTPSPAAIRLDTQLAARDPSSLVRVPGFAKGQYVLRSRSRVPTNALTAAAGGEPPLYELLDAGRPAAFNIRLEEADKKMVGEVLRVTEQMVTSTLLPLSHIKQVKATIITGRYLQNYLGDKFMLGGTGEKTVLVNRRPPWEMVRSPVCEGTISIMVHPAATLPGRITAASLPIGVLSQIATNNPTQPLATLAQPASAPGCMPEHNVRVVVDPDVAETGEIDLGTSRVYLDGLYSMATGASRSGVEDRFTQAVADLFYLDPPHADITLPAGLTENIAAAYLQGAVEWLLAPDSRLTDAEIYQVSLIDKQGKFDLDLADGQQEVWQLILLGCVTDVWKTFARVVDSPKKDRIDLDDSEDLEVDFEEHDLGEEARLDEQAAAEAKTNLEHERNKPFVAPLQAAIKKKRVSLLDTLAQTLVDQWISKLIDFLGMDTSYKFSVPTKNLMKKIAKRELHRAFPLSRQLTTSSEDTRTHNVLLDHPLVRKFVNTWQVQSAAYRSNINGEQQTSCFDHVWWAARNNYYMRDTVQIQGHNDASSTSSLHTGVTPETDQFQIPLIPPSRHCRIQPCPQCGVVKDFVTSAWLKQKDGKSARGEESSNFTPEQRTERSLDALLTFPVQMAVCSSVGRWRLLRPVDAAVDLRPLLRLSQPKAQFSAKTPLDTETLKFAAAELDYLDRVARSYTGVQNPDTGRIRGQSQITTRHVNKLLYLSVTNTKHIDAVSRDERNTDTHQPDKGGTFGRMDWGTTVQSQMSHTIVQQYNKADRQMLWVCQKCHTPLAPGATKLVCPRAQWDRDLETQIVDRLRDDPNADVRERNARKRTRHDLRQLMTKTAGSRFYGQLEEKDKNSEDEECEVAPLAEADQMQKNDKGEDGRLGSRDAIAPKVHAYNVAVGDMGDKFTLVGSMQATSTAALIGVAGNMHFTLEPNKVENQNTELTWDELANPEVAQMRRMAARDF
jgi:hypothetical protein